jgi:tetratricopeptide (TPR) repeat protein
MRRVVLATVLLVVASTARADVSATLKLDRQRIAVGDVAELSVEVSGAQDVGAPAVAAPDGLRIDYRGQSTSVSIVNGRMSATASHTYAVTAERAGTYTIGPVQVDYGGRTIDAGVVRLLVVAGHAGQVAAPGGQGLRLVAEVSDHRVYLYQPLRLTLRLEVRGVQVADLQYPTVTADGLTVGGFPEPSQRRERGPGGPVDVVEFETEVVPVRTGTLSLGPATMQLSVVVRGRADPFFGGMFGSRKPRTLTADPVAIEVVPLPADGRPAGFSGAVGRFTLDVKAKPKAVDAGDPVTFDVTVSGTGSLAQAKPPAVAATPGLKVYDPSEQQTATRDGAVSTRRFEQVVIPERAGTVTIPPIEFSYFDPSAARYVTARGPAVVVAVRPRASTTPDVVVGAPAPTRATPPKPLGRDIVFIKDDPGTFRPIDAPTAGSAWFWALQLVPLVVLAAVVVWDRRRARFGADPRLARFAGAGAAARRALAAAARSGEPDAVARAYAEYLCAKLDLAPGAVASEAVRSRLVRAGVGAEVVADATGLLEACEHDRYRPAPGGADGLLSRAQRVVAALERERRIVAPMLVVLVVLGAVVAGAADAPKTLFFRGNTLYADGRFDDAAAAWQQILDAGLESGPLYYNLGNARLRADDPGRAILDYERAWRLMPGDADLMANLRFAKDDADPTEGMSLAGRIAFPLATRVTTARLVTWGAVAYWLLVGALIAGRLVPGGRRAAKAVALVGALALATTASAALYRHVRVDSPAWAVVLRDAKVRFEPATAGTVHYDAPAGTVVEVLATREGWAQVARRRDGVRGWVERKAIEAVDAVPRKG